MHWVIVHITLVPLNHGHSLIAQWVVSHDMQDLLEHLSGLGDHELSGGGDRGFANILKVPVDSDEELPLAGKLCIELIVRENLHSVRHC